jgi:hypothetical protein
MICSPEGGCWCAELPHGRMPVEPDGCLCPDCLRKDLQRSREMVAERGEVLPCARYLLRREALHFTAR